MFELSIYEPKSGHWYVYDNYSTRAGAEMAAMLLLPDTETRIVDTEAGGFITKDNGQREQLANGMVRSPEEDKANYVLITRGPMFDRWAELLTRGAKIYGEDNWMLALAEKDPTAREKTKKRYLRSAARHFRQWLRGDRDEDHAAAVFFNLNGYEAMLATDPKEES